MPEPLKIRVEYDDGPEAVEERIEEICNHFGIPFTKNAEEDQPWVDYVIGENDAVDQTA